MFHKIQWVSILDDAFYFILFLGNIYVASPETCLSCRFWAGLRGRTKRFLRIPISALPCSISDRRIIDGDILSPLFSPHFLFIYMDNSGISNVSYPLINQGKERSSSHTFLDIEGIDLCSSHVHAGWFILMGSWETGGRRLSLVQVLLRWAKTFNRGRNAVGCSPTVVAHGRLPRSGAA